MEPGSAGNCIQRDDFDKILPAYKEADVVVEAEDVVAEDAKPVCPVCGAKAESKFCPECGAPMGE